MAGTVSSDNEEFVIINDSETILENFYGKFID